MVVVSNSYLEMPDMTINAQYILNYFLAKGWTKNAICGMLGNMQSESTINPGLWEVGGGGGFGLVQWTPASDLYNITNTINVDPNTMDGQLAAIQYEVDNGLQWIYSGMTFQEFTHSTDTPYNL